MDVNKIKTNIGSDAIPVPPKDSTPKKKHLKFTFQPMVGGIRKTVYRYGVGGLEEMFQKLSDVVPDGYAIAFNIKIFPMIQDSYLRGLMEKDKRITESKFDVNQKIGNQMAEMCEGDKKDTVQDSSVDGGSKI